MDSVLPTWPAPPNVKALTTARRGGVSAVPYDSLNLAEHVGDDAQAVRANRACLRKHLQLPSEPRWLRQVHGTGVIELAGIGAADDLTADGSFTRCAGVVCTVLTADCLPILLCDRRGTMVGALHAGWRGLAAGIIEAGVERMDVPGASLLAWLGPAIGPAAFEVGDDVRAAFVRADADAARAFVLNARGRWLADLYQLARRRLERLDVTAVFGGEHCTATQADLFYSYRRDGATGRMASIIWLA